MACLAIKKCLDHDYKFRHHIPSAKEFFETKKSGKKRIEGKILYAGMLRLSYRYKLDNDPVKGFNLTIKIHVKNWNFKKKSPFKKMVPPERLKY